MAAELARIATFCGWNGKTSLSVLAIYGFYLRDNQFRCSGCSFTSTSENSLIDRHKEQSPQCINSTSSHKTHEKNQLETASYSRSADEDKVNLTSMSSTNTMTTARIDSFKPEIQRLLDVSERLKTFQYFPQNVGVDPTELAKAGFFYTGKRDLVECAFCSGKLYKWESGENPMEEHRRHFPECCFVQSNDEEASPVNCTVNRTDISKYTGVRKDIDKRMITSRLDLPIVSKLISMGYSAELIKTALEHRLADTGDDFENAADMIAAVYELEKTSGDKTSSANNSVLRVSSQTTASLSLSLSSSSSSSLSPISSSSTKQMDEDVISKSIRNSTENISQLDLKKASIKATIPCRICCDADVDVVFIPCGHMISCSRCSTRIENCPVCRNKVAQRVRTYYNIE